MQFEIYRAGNRNRLVGNCGYKEMAKLTKISETIYGCSECADFRIEIVRPAAKTPAQLEKWIGQEFLNHLKWRHSNEDENDLQDNEIDLPSET
jgi:hypothetical protein